MFGFSKFLTNWKLFVYVVTIAILALFLFFLAEGCSTLFVGVPNKNMKSTSTKIYEYRFLKRDSKSQSKSYGVVSLPQFLGENEFISYNDAEENDILISNFGEEEYECEGSCHCASGDITPRKISHLLSSSSSSSVLSKAKDFFNKECLKVLSDECHQSYIISEVDECSEIGVIYVSTKNKHEKREKNLEDEDRFPSGELDEEYIEIYHCSGSCVARTVGKSERVQKLRVDIDCKQLKTEGEIEIASERHIFEEESGDFETIPPESINNAKEKFSRTILQDFCRENSKVEETFHVEGSDGPTFATLHRCFEGSRTPENERENIYCMLTEMRYFVCER